MSNQDFYTLTPGSGVADSLQEILARRKLDSRTAMLDQLNQKNLEHGWRNQDENLALNREQEARMATNEAADNTRADAAMVGESADPSQFNPNLHKFFQGIGAIKTQPGQTPSVSSQTLDVDGNVIGEDPTVSGPKTPDKEVFLGNAAHQAEEAKKTDIGALANNPDFAKMTPLQQVLAGAQAGVNIPGQALGQPGHIRYIDPRNPNALNGTEVNPNDKVIEGNWPPQAPQSTFSWAGVDPTSSNPIFLGNRPNAQGHPNVVDATGKPYTGNIGAKPTANQNQTKVPPMLRDAYRKALAGGTTNNARVQQQQALSTIIASYQTTPDVKGFVMQAIQYAQAHPGVPIEQLITMIDAPMTPQEQSDTYDLLITALGTGQGAQ